MYNNEIESQGKIDHLINTKAFEIRYQTLDDLYKGINFNIFPQNSRIICFCTMGIRSKKAADFLRLYDIEA